MGNRVLSEFLFQPLSVLFKSAEFRRAVSCNSQSASVNMFASLAGFPAEGAASVIYLAEDTSKIYYWNGTEYVEMSPGTGGSGPATAYPIGIAVSDEVSLVSIGLKHTFRIPTDYTVTTIKASLVEAPAGSPLTIDIKKNGTSIFSTLLTIDAGETTSVTAAVPAVISTPNFLSDDVITVHITLIGSTSAGRGLKLWFL